MGLVNFKEQLYESLRDDEYATYYLQGAYEDSPGEFFHAVQELAIARGGIQAISKEIGRGRCSLYKSLNRDAHPKFETIDAILKSAGFRLKIEPVGVEVKDFEVNKNAFPAIEPSDSDAAPNEGELVPT